MILHDDRTMKPPDVFLMIIWNRGTCFVADIRMFVVEFKLSNGYTVDPSNPLRNNNNY